ncbi:hypothetical protein MRS76_20530 [Rhizobiaceae bacterium n13]|uniref:hypothetical protein n=1 Tax=Ferirhizobium litorale TaxID=2927786 RepID=UPI0024B29D80|nr:hypothetical protein [Fererhizobium litorale]MDI7864329.1 hypothetical protein [Fererhizobium litorale]
MQAPANHFTPFAARTTRRLPASSGPFTPRLPRMNPVLADRLLFALLCIAAPCITFAIAAGI